MVFAVSFGETWRARNRAASDWGSKGRRFESAHPDSRGSALLRAPQLPGLWWPALSKETNRPGKARIEQRRLADRFGETYASYRRGSSALIPGIV